MQMVVYSLSCHTVKLGSQVVRSQLGHRNPSRFVILFESPMRLLCQSFYLRKRTRSRLLSPITVVSSCPYQVNVAGLWMFRHHLSDGIPLPKSMHCTQRPLIVLLLRTRPDSSAILLCYSEPRPRGALPFVLLFTGLFLLLSLKVLGRMEGFKEGRSVSTPRASSQFCLTCCITFLLQTKSIKAPEIPL